MAGGGWGPGPAPGPGPNQGPGSGGSPGPQPYGPPPYGPYPPPNPYAPRPPYPGPYPPPPPRRRFGSIPVIRSARRRADAIFNRPGGGRVDDPLIRRVQLWRAVAGAAATLLLLYTYGTDGGWSGAANEGFTKVVLAPLLLALLAPLVITGFIRLAPPDKRPVLRSRLWEPVKAFLWYVGTMVGTGAVLSGGNWLMNEVGKWGGLVAIAMLAAVAWLMPFVIFSSLNAAKYAFNSGYVHAFLPAVLTIALVWALALIGAITEGMPNGPREVQLCALFGGPLSVTAVALWELHRLRTRFGVRLRGRAPGSQ